MIEQPDSYFVVWVTDNFGYFKPIPNQKRNNELEFDHSDNTRSFGT